MLDRSLIIDSLLGIAYLRQKARTPRLALAPKLPSAARPGTSPCSLCTRHRPAGIRSPPRQRPSPAILSPATKRGEHLPTHRISNSVWNILPSFSARQDSGATPNRRARPARLPPPHCLNRRDTSRVLDNWMTSGVYVVLSRCDVGSSGASGPPERGGPPAIDVGGRIPETAADRAGI